MAGLRRTGGAQTVLVPLPPPRSSIAEPGKQISDPSWDSGKVPQVTVNNTKMPLIGKGLVSSFNSVDVCLVFLRKNNLLYLKGESI